MSVGFSKQEFNENSFDGPLGAKMDHNGWKVCVGKLVDLGCDL